MSTSLYSKVILPFIQQFTCDSILLTGKAANNLIDKLNNSRSHTLSSPFHLQQLEQLPQIDLAIVSDLVETTNKKHTIEWLGLLKNRYSQHIILITSHEEIEKQGWQLADFLALGFRLAFDNDAVVFTYNIKNYQFKKDWLNSRHWANPENFDKYRW